MPGVLGLSVGNRHVGRRYSKIWLSGLSCELNFAGARSEAHWMMIHKRGTPAGFRLGQVMMKHPREFRFHCAVLTNLKLR